MTVEAQVCRHARIVRDGTDNSAPARSSGDDSDDGKGNDEGRGDDGKGRDGDDGKGGESRPCYRDITET
ncbi:hypothetical protein [Rugosimonospora africana]|uniref:Uncharacterized protein n=1 Tax=Rugosimonospora africana TaxID=556532 RepID=A0A8J3QQE9_9ACTN|nr:hypothetical protein [Rugosimonospora africana]GIH15555.1 hypothetical protein Raf01_37270 [Rugosimonospora africana]